MRSLLYGRWLLCREAKKGGLDLAATRGLHISLVVLNVVVVVGQSLHGTGATAQYRQNDRASFVSHQKPHAWSILLSLPTYLSR